MEILGIERAPSAGMSRQPIFGLIAGRAYANLNTLARIVRAVPGLDRLDFAEGLGGEHGELLAGLIRQEPAGELAARQLRRRGSVRAFLRFAVWCVVHAVDQRSARRLGRFPPPRGPTGRLRPCRQVGCGTARPPRGAVESLETVWPRHGGQRRRGHGRSSVSSSTSSKAAPETTDGAIANRMLGGLNGLASAEAGLDLWRLAAWTGRQPRLRAIVAETADFESLRRRLAGTATMSNRAGVPRALGPVHAPPWPPCLRRIGRP